MEPELAKAFDLIELRTPDARAVTELTVSLLNLRSDVGWLRSEFEAVLERMTSLEEAQSALASILGEQIVELRKMQDRIGKLDSMDVKLDALNGVVGGNHKAIGRLDASLEVLHAKVRRVDERVQVIDEKVRRVDERVQVIDEKVQEVDERVQVIDEKVQEVADTQREQGESINELRRDVSELQDGMSELHEGMSELLVWVRTQGDSA